MTEKELEKYFPLYTDEEEYGKDGWHRSKVARYAWEELHKTFPKGDGSLVSQLAAHLEHLADALAEKIHIGVELQLNQLVPENTENVQKVD